MRFELGLRAGGALLLAALVGIGWAGCQEGCIRHSDCKKGDVCQVGACVPEKDMAGAADLLTVDLSAPADGGLDLAQDGSPAADLAGADLL